mgnify:CR=1 FL=1
MNKSLLIESSDGEWFFSSRLFNLWLLVTLLLVSTSGGAANVDLTQDFFHMWDGVGMDATKTEESIGSFDTNLNTPLGQGATVLGPANGAVLKNVYADLTQYDYIHVEGTAGTEVRFVFNRQHDDNTNSGIEEFTATIPESGSMECALSNIKSDFKHLNAIKLAWNEQTDKKVTKLQVYRGYHIHLTCNDESKVAASWLVDGDDKTRYIDAWAIVPDAGHKITFTASVKDEYKNRFLVKWNVGNATKEWIDTFEYIVSESDANSNNEIDVELIVAEGMKMTVGVCDGVPADAYNKIGVRPSGYDQNVDGQLLHKGTKVTFFADEIAYATFTGWYKNSSGTDSPVSTDKEYTVQPVEDLTLYAGYRVSSISEERTITVDGKIRKYWLHVPASVAGKTNVPVVFSLHGRGNNDNPIATNDNGEIADTGKPIFTSLSEKEGFIVVYPQGRHAQNDNDSYSKDDPNWNNGFANTTGWEATGKENADTKFIKALADEIKKNSFGAINAKVDPKKFYLCGFSMGGMMTYACANVLNGTFAAYGACSGFPMNEFHLNLATENPMPFIHLHGANDNVVEIKYLNTIIDNLLARNGCDLSGKTSTDTWTTTTSNGETHSFKRYDFVGINKVPVTTVTFNGLWHSVEASAPQYLWNFFKDKATDTYQTSDIEWKWDMPTINSFVNTLGDSDGQSYGWHRVVKGNERSLIYGDESDKTGTTNVYHSIQLAAGKHTLYATADVAKDGTAEGFVSVTLKNNLTGAEIVARKLVNNQGTSTANNMQMLYEFEVGADAEYALVIKRSSTSSACVTLEIHRGSYRPANIKDQSLDNATWNITDGKLAELTFENGSEGTDILPLTSGNGAELTSADGMKLYLKSRLGIKEGQIDNKDKYIVKDPIFGHYFQNIPDADIYDRYFAEDYLRVVLGNKNSLSGHDNIEGIQTTGKVTIGFWVNADLAVNRGLAYDLPSMFYMAGNSYKGTNKTDNPHMFNITCNGGLSGYMDGGNYQFATDINTFGELCDNSSNAAFYKKNFYKDCNWHYITYQMYDGLSRYNMYVDGEPTYLGGYAEKPENLSSCVSGLNSIVLGGANANNVRFAYDVAFAYDDIVIYNRVLSKREINEIIKAKHYTPSVWNFRDNVKSNVFFNPDNIDKSLWNYSASDETYTLNKNFEISAALTYDGINEIPAFKGLQFVTGGTNKIVIDAKTGLLKLSKGVKIVFSNMVKDNYVRVEHKKLSGSDPWHGFQNENMGQIFGILSTMEGYERTAFKVKDAGDNLENSVTMPTDIEIAHIEATDKYFAQIKFVKDNQSTELVTDPKDKNDLPEMNLYINGTERLHGGYPETNHRFKFSSSSPHVASVDGTGNVTLYGVAGSTIITAELINDEARKYDCDLYDEYTFEPSNHIFASYEIVVSPKANSTFKVEDKKEYQVGNTFYNTDKTIGVTLGGWTYNDGGYYGLTDSYSQKEVWGGQKYAKDDDRTTYLDDRKTEEEVFPEFFSGNESFSTQGKEVAKSESLLVDDAHAYTSTGNYQAPADNKSEQNKTPWLLPCRGSHIKIEPTSAGIVSVYVMQEGCVTHVPEGQTMDVDGQTYAANEPIDVTVKKVYVADEKGEIVKEVVADTKSKVASQMWKDDGRARAEYFWGDQELAYNDATMKSFDKIEDFDDKWSFLDNWPNPGMQQHVFKLGKDEDGHVLITKGIVRYTFNVLPGKTYYIFSNTSKIGLAGFTFEKGKLAKYEKVKPDAKHEEWRATGEFTNIAETDVTLNGDENYTAHTDTDAKVTLRRTFYKNYWNPICLPYSINRRQIEEVFGDGTMVVLMNNINTATKKIMFIEHANQDIIAGYPYLIFPTKKDDTEKTDHGEINGITTYATFGEADKPLFTVGTDGNTYAGTAMQDDALVFKGVFDQETMPLGSYGITKTGKLSRVAKEGLSMKPYRAYIHFNQTTAGAKAITLSSMEFSDFGEQSGATTSIEDVLLDNGIMSGTFDVYSISGVKVRSHAHNLYGLPKGVYIVNGKKYVHQ